MMLNSINLDYSLLSPTDPTNDLDPPSHLLLEHTTFILYEHNIHFMRHHHQLAVPSKYYWIKTVEEFSH